MICSLDGKLLQEKGEDVQVLWDKLMTLVANTVAALHGPTMEALERIDSTGENLFQAGLPVPGTDTAAKRMSC